MTIVPVTSLPSLPSINGVSGAATAATPEAAQSFGDLVASGLDNVQQAQSSADSLAQQAATGDLTDLHDYMIASTQAQLATDLTVSVRNKAVEAFNEIMRMQV
jgi:flagellar hook-basal body complex protein FliE